MWKFHDWDSYTWDKEELGQPDGILLALPPCLSQDTAVPRCSVPSQRWHSAPHTCPTLWHNSQSSSDISENSIPQDHPVTWELTDSLSLQSCGADFTFPAADCPQCPQSSTAFKQEPRCPPVNHLAHPPHPQHNGRRTAHTFSTFSTPFTATASSRDHGEHEPPTGVCSRPPAGSARTGGCQHCVPS